jgi:hypothetical protein
MMAIYFKKAKMTINVKRVKIAIMTINSKRAKKAMMGNKFQKQKY